MQTFTGRCLCGQSHFTVDVEMLDVYACHCTLHFPSSNRGERFFCSGCGCPLWFTLTGSDRYFVPWTLLELNEVDRRRLVLAAEIYTETQPAFWRLTGQYARLSGKEVEEMDYPCHLAH